MDEDDIERHNFEYMMSEFDSFYDNEEEEEEEEE